VPDIKRVFWDSCVFIILLSKHKRVDMLEKQQICAACLQNAIDGKTEIFISTITIVEVNKTIDSSHPIPDEIKERIKNLIEQPFIKIVSADLARSIEARDLIWKYSWLSPTDSIHLACALYAKVDELFTYDGKGKEKGLLDLDGMIGTPLLKISPPHFEAIQIATFTSETGKEAWGKFPKKLNESD
jgi:predicted nucleic acid-binding protein